MNIPFPGANPFTPYLLYVKVAGLAILAALVLGGGWLIHSQRLTIDELQLSEAHYKQLFETDQVLLTDLNKKHNALKADLLEAQKQAGKVRVVYQTKVQKIMQEKVPEDCQGAADWAIDQAIKGAKQ